MKTLTIVLDQSQAKFFSGCGLTEKLKPMFIIENKNSRRKEQSYNSDRSGRSVNRANSMNHTNEREVSSKEHNLDVYCKDVSDETSKIYNDTNFERIVLVSTPKVLGKIRSKMKKNILNLIVDEIQRDYTSYSLDELNDALVKNVHL